MTERSQTDHLCSASANGNLDDVKQCLQNGADVNGYNAHGRTPLQVVKLGCPAVALHLLDSGAYPNLRDPVHCLTVLHDAARDGYVDMVQVLVSHGASAHLVDLVDDRGNLPLHLAAQEGHTGVVRLLIELTANPGLENFEGHSAYDLAHEGGKMATAKWISDHFELLF